MRDDVDPDFQEILAALAGSGIEIEFERRGEGVSTYPFHGEVVSVDAVAGTIQILRTRTHAGQIHTMGLRYFLSATPAHSSALFNTAAQRGLQQELNRISEREKAIEHVKAGSYPSVNPGSIRSRYKGTFKGKMEQYPAVRYVYADITHPDRTVGITAKSPSDATRFITAQDLFTSLDDALLIAISGHVLWPAGIAYDRLQDPAAWKAPWLEIFKTLDGLPTNVLDFYLTKVRSEVKSVSSVETIGASGAKILSDRGLLYTEAPPGSYEETVKRIPVAGLKQLLRQAGVKGFVSTRLLLETQLLPLMTPELQAKALTLMPARKPKTMLRAPCSMSLTDFLIAIKEMRASIFIMRQWLRATWELDRESELRLLTTEM